MFSFMCACILNLISLGNKLVQGNLAFSLSVSLKIIFSLLEELFFDNLSGVVFSHSGTISCNILNITRTIKTKMNGDDWGDRGGKEIYKRYKVQKGGGSRRPYTFCKFAILRCSRTIHLLVHHPRIGQGGGVQEVVGTGPPSTNLNFDTGVFDFY